MAGIPSGTRGFPDRSQTIAAAVVRGSMRFS